MDNSVSQSVRVVLECSGQLRAGRSVLVGSELIGRVSEVLVQEGQRVRQGTLLAKLECTAARLELSAAEARLRLALAESSNQTLTQDDPAVWQIKSQLQQAMITEEKLQAEVQAACAVLTSDSPISAMNQALETLATLNERLDASKKQIAELQNKLRQALQEQSERREKQARSIDAQAQLIAEAKLQVAQAEVLRHRHHLERLRIRAPFDGTIIRRCVEPGAVVVPGVNGAICELADFSSLFAQVGLSERDIHQIKLQQPCRVMLLAVPGLTLNGQVERIAPIVDPETHTVRVDVGLQPTHEFRKLWPNMLVVVQFLATANVFART